MGLVILKDVLEKLDAYQADVIVYVPEDADEVTADTSVLLEEHGGYSDKPGYKYFLEIGVISEVLQGLESVLGQLPTVKQKVRALVYYATYDAYPEIDETW